MKKLDFDYSMKNIPVTTEKGYFLKLIKQIEIVIKRVRIRIEKYGLNSQKTAPPIKKLPAFENDLIKLVKSIKFRVVHSQPQLQRALKSDMLLIHQSRTTLRPTEKTSNMYRLTKEEYKKMCRDAITSI